MEDGGHSALLTEADAGCLMLADISGYTAYLNHAELEHAHDILRDLTETITNGMEAVAHIAEIEGDAVFAYALEGELDSAMLLDSIEDTYFRFRSRVRDIAQATSCACNACRLIPSLDLKFVTHAGRFVRGAVGRGVKPMGADVVLAHRLLKNTVREHLDVSAYALFTDPCVKALGVDPEVLGWQEHWERVEGVGDLLCHVEDLSTWFRVEQERRPVRVAPAEASFEIVRPFDVPAATLWEYQTSPQKRLLWQTEFSSIDETNPRGRRGVGTTSHCVHGRGAISEQILDWRPCRYFTVRITVPMVGPWVSTFEFVPLPGDRTELHFRAQRLTGPRRVLAALMRRPLMSALKGNLARLDEVLSKRATSVAP